MAWLDAMRGLAVLGMLHTHVTNTLLDPAWRTGPMIDRLVFCHGLVAPSFLWIAGYAHGLGLWRRLGRDGAAFPWRGVRRLLLVGLLGYALHLPWGGSPAAWRAFRSPDILQCLAVSLLAMLAGEGLARRFSSPRGRKPAMFAWVSACGAAAVWLAPRAGQWCFGPGWLHAYFDTSGRTLFPLVPWLGFAAAGVLAAALPGKRGILLLLAAGLLYFIPSAAPFSAAAPAFFLQRLGVVAFASGLIAWSCRRLVVPACLLLAGRESLVVYVGHLVLLHWFPWAPAMGQTLGPMAVTAAFLALAAASLGLALASERMKARRAGSPTAA